MDELAKKQERGRKAHATGLAAEDSAARLMMASGAVILATRYRTPQGEIDLIAAEDDTLVFVEVKARRSRDEAAYAISPRQWARLEGAALHVLSVLGTEDCFAEFAAAHPQPDMRFDAVLVSGDGQAEWIKNVRGFDEW